VIFKAQDNIFKIVVFNTDDVSVPEEARKVIYDDRISFVAKGNYLPDEDACIYDVQGKWVDNGRYGLQLSVESCLELTPDTVEGIKAYLSSGYVKGIGKKLAEAIVDEFGMNTLDVMENAPNKLLAIKGISEKNLLGIVESYNSHRTLQTLALKLSPIGVTMKKCEAIYHQFRDASLQILKDDPFMLTAIKGFGFLTVDGIARKLGCKPTDPGRIQAGMEFVLKAAGIEGHLFLKKGVLIEESHNILNKGYPEDTVPEEELLAQYINMEDKRIIVTEKKCVYHRIMYDHEVAVAESVVKLLGGSIDPVDCTELMRHASQSLDIKFSKEQEQAVSMAFSNRISIITGGPGTGKTTVLKAILHVFKRLFQGSVLLAAPTGKAARRMHESTGENAMTLHRALRMKSDDDQENPTGIDYDFVVVDEFSMVDMSLCSWLFRSLKSSCSIVLVGDADQLPSVGPGNVFYEFINCKLIPVTRLSYVYRQQSGSIIARNAAKIRDGDHALSYGDEFSLRPCESAKDASDLIAKLYLEELAQKDISTVQVLTPIRKNGLAASNFLNIRLRDLANPADPSKNEIWIGQKLFRTNDRVMQIKNQLDISNGDVGTITSIQPESKPFPPNRSPKDMDPGERKQYAPHVNIAFTDDRRVCYNYEEMEVIEHAYAVTIHKSQGSEYETVIMPLLMDFYIMLRRNLVYTGITRAKKKVVIIGSSKALGIAIAKNDIATRNTKLGERIISQMALVPSRAPNIGKVRGSRDENEVEVQEEFDADYDFEDWPF
jgi:exodeoxyribonuclease V alpha subunit